MVINEDSLTGTVLRGTLTILGWTRMKGSKRMYAFKCSECARDPELYGDGIFESDKESLIVRGYKPCACGRAYRHSQNQYEIMAKRKAQELGVEFIKWNEDFKGGSTKVLMSCEEGTWTPRVQFFINKGHIAFNRGKTRKDDALVIEKFFSSGVFHEDTLFERVKINKIWHWKVDCPVCGGIGYSQPQHLQRGNRPCECGNYKQKFAYITVVKDGELPIALKFGISRSKSLRLKYQARETVYQVESYGVWEFPDKLSCVKAEKACKVELICGVLSRSEFADGFTETTQVYNLEKIINIYESFGGLRLDVSKNM